MQDALIGMWVLGQYRIIKPLEIGGMGTIYLAEQPSTARHAALKFLRPDKERREHTERRFRREARAVSRLAHPNIVTVYNFGELSDGTLFLAMEYVEGEKLTSLIQSEPIPLMRTINAIYQCAAALGYAHSMGIIHRDFKPDNVIVTRLLGREHVKVLDFGIARLMEETGSTQSGSIVGTPEFLSPEQCLGDEVTSLVDQYALGLVFYMMLTGQRPFESHSLMGYVYQHQNVTPTPPADLIPGHDMKLLSDIVMRMLSKSPHDRFPDMTQILDRLSRVAEQIMSSSRSADSSSTVLLVPEPSTDAPGARTVRSRALAPPLGSACDTIEATPRQVMLLVSDPTADNAARGALERLGFQTQGPYGTPADLADREIRADFWLLSPPLDRWRLARDEWREAGLRPERTLLCLDASHDSPGALEAINLFDNVIIGCQPLDPAVVAGSLHLMRGANDLALEALLPGQPVQTLQFSTINSKSFCVEALLDDLSNNRVESAVRCAAKELVEEMILNALLNGHDKFVRRREGTLFKAEPGEMDQPGQDCLLRWAIGEHFIVLAVADPFGSLEPQDIVRSLTGPVPRVKTQDRSRSAGLGLRIMLRAASHLGFSISPYRRSEVIALVARDRSPMKASIIRDNRRSLCVVQRGQGVDEKLGDNLLLQEDREQNMFRLFGDIDETADLTGIFGRSGPVTLDLSNVTGINSKGIHAWIMASSRRNADLQLSLYRCSPAIVRQFNLVTELLEGCQVVSILVPFYCWKCGEEKARVVEASEMREGSSLVHTCPTCSEKLFFEGLPEEYFAFLFGDTDD